MPTFYDTIFGIILLLLLRHLPMLHSCEVLAKVKSETQKSFIFELSMPEVFKEQIEFTEPAQKEILIKAPNCAAKHWQLLTMTREENGTLVVVDEASSKLDGTGELTIRIGDELQPQFRQRFGIVCSEATLNLCI